uniref:Uncharacterized protein n=1 Tax=Physcomitrium patens TaxID=3218 RepID=A0A2K1KEI8_PHYPA|nr:hypothetical protein PHYPA_008543 [Physcomitrium patens]
MMYYPCITSISVAIVPANYNSLKKVVVEK